MQVLKPELRERILRGAAAVFVESGYAGATMAAIARRAGMSTGNLYRYFETKDVLFRTLFPEELGATFLALVRRRVRSLGQLHDLEALGPEARADAEALLRFWIDNRAQVVVLLAHAEGSPFSSLRERFIDELVRLTSASLRGQRGGARLSKTETLVLRVIFENTVRAIVALLERGGSDEQIAQAFGGFWSYQLAGLAGLKRWVTT